MNTLHQEIENIKNQLIEKYKPEKIILFGSHAWGEPTPDSDVDLCIVKQGVDEQRFYKRVLEATKSFKHKIATDVLVYSPREIRKEIWLGNPFIRKIIDKGKTLYATPNYS